jgi:nucleotide-binding universal stress UspA family protein
LTGSGLISPCKSRSYSKAEHCAMPSLRPSEHIRLPNVAAGTTERQRRRIVIAIDDSFVPQVVIPHGMAIAKALDADVMLFRILESKQWPGEITDPVQWHLLREQARNHIQELAERHAWEAGRIETRIDEGQPCDQICRWMREHQGSLTVLSSRGSAGLNEPALGRTARRVVESGVGSILLVPAIAQTVPTVRYSRILIPLDGSSRAESALPIALRVAESMNAEILLVHAVPEPELTEIGPLEPEGLELRAGLLRRNERVARAYLERIRSHLSARVVRVQMIVLRGGDSRHLLTQAISDQHADLVVMASHGHGGHMDLPFGSVASHIVEQTPVPVLLVRNHHDAPAIAGGTPTIRHDPFSVSPGRPPRIAA